MTPEKKKELARFRAKEILTNNDLFRNMSLEQQKKMYLEVVNEQMQKLEAESDLSGGMARRSEKASDLLDDARHEKDFSDGVDAFEDLVDSVDFPKFVGDLLRSVFDANISVMKSQTDDYIRLMKEASSGLEKFITAIDDTTTFAYLAENNRGKYNIAMEKKGDSKKMVLTDSSGSKVNENDSEVKMAIMDAKIKMAQEHRAALREMILMGVTRLVVEKGEVEAEVNFEFKGSRSVDKSDMGTMTEDSKSTAGGSITSLPFLKGLGIGGGYSRETTKTKLSVSSTDSTASDELKAKLRGFVNIKFKTDYFKLDNFAKMYGPVTDEAKEAAGKPAGLPAG